MKTLSPNAFNWVLNFQILIPERFKPPTQYDSDYSFCAILKDSRMGKNLALGPETPLWYQKYTIHTL